MLRPPCAGLFHEGAPIHLLRRVLIVGATQEADPGRLVQMRPRESIEDLVSLLAERRDERTSFAAVRAMLFTVRR
jgi:hypothetical protein